MSNAAAQDPAPLDDVMLAMDVVDTLRHRQDLVTRELASESREAQLINRLRDIYHQQGIEVSDVILREGVAALEHSRFTYVPPPPGLKRRLAELYVRRKTWGPAILALMLMLLVAGGGYFLVYKPFQNGLAEQARIELAETLPATMDRLYDDIFNATKVQRAAHEAEEIRNRGKAAAMAGDRAGAEQAVESLTRLRDTLRQEYSLRVVNREGTQSGFWTIPEINTEATNYYVVVEALDPRGEPVTLPIHNEESGETEMVSMWGVRVPEAVYRTVEADKRDDGIIQRNVIGLKEYGFLEVDYAVPVLGGTVTRW
jgi:hypothetical protein